jgi:branched-subunit amino acid transport protein AzlD
MPDATHLAAVVAVAAAITVALRAAPFAVLSRLRSSAATAYLGRHLPTGVMLILVVYLLRDLPVGRPVAALGLLVPVAVTAGVHLWRRHALLSMTAGTLTYALALAVLPG